MNTLIKPFLPICAGLLLCSPTSSGAQEQSSLKAQANMAICNTPREVATLIGFGAANADTRSSLQKMQRAHAETSCALMTVAFYKEKVIAQIKVPNGTVNILQIRVVGVYDGERWLKLPFLLRYTTDDYVWSADV